MRKKKRAYRLFRKNDTQRTNKLLGSKELILHTRDTRSVGKGSHIPMVVYAYAHAQPSKHVA